MQFRRTWERQEHCVCLEHYRRQPNPAEHSIRSKDQDMAGLCILINHLLNEQNITINYAYCYNMCFKGGVGSVNNVSFSNVEVSDVKVPIAIDQYYCDKCLCKNQTQAVAISDVKFKQVVGTYASQPIYIACSRNVPCTNIDLIDIELEPSPKFGGFQQALCYNSYGKSSPPLLPSVMDYCLRSENGAEGRISWSPDTVC